MVQPSPRLTLLLTGMALVLAIEPVAAVEIYKWVSEDGSTHYSESRPDTEIGRFEVLEVTPATPPSPPAENDYQATLDMAASLQADRLERERVRLEREKLRQQERRARSEAQRYYNDTYAAPSYLVPYYRYPYRSYPRPPHHGKYPGYPPSRPPAGPYRAPNVPKRVYLNR